MIQHSNIIGRCAFLFFISVAHLISNTKAEDFGLVNVFGIFGIGITQPSAIPTIIPATNPPTKSPTLSPDISEARNIIESSVKNVQMTLVGMNEKMLTSVQASWKRYTTEHIDNYFKGNRNGISSFTATLTVQEQTFESGSRRNLRRNRSLQSSGGKVIISYTQKNVYTINKTEVGAEKLAMEAFETSDLRKDYIKLLKGTGISAFSSLESVQEIDIVELKVGKVEDPSVSSNSILPLIIVSLGGGGVVLVLVLLFLRCRKGKAASAELSKMAPSEEADNGHRGDAENTGPETRHMNVDATTAGNKSSGGTGEESLATAGHGGACDNSVSTASEILEVSDAGDNAVGTNQTRGGSGEHESKMEEELIDIYAPPGKLGVVVDTPRDAPPTVHAVKATSIIADKLRVGDRIIALDDEDVRTETAITVSKMIARRSANSIRKLTIIRTIVHND